MKKFVTGTLISLGTAITYIIFPALTWTFYKELKYWPNICNPKTKNEKFLWRKIFDRNPLYRLLTDKLSVRQFIAMKCPTLLMSEIIWIGVSPDQIPSDILQPTAIIKTNNGSNRNIFVEKLPVDRREINRLITHWLTQPYDQQGEWTYENIVPLAFVERGVSKPGDAALLDISCHVAGAQCLLATVEMNLKRENERIAYFDESGTRIDMSFKMDGAPELPPDFVLPVNFSSAVQLAKRIASDFDYIRVDFMNVGDRLYFCECTVFPMGGYSVISADIDSRIAAAWDLRNSWFMRQPQRGLRRLYRNAYYSWLTLRDQQEGHGNQTGAS